MVLCFLINNILELDIFFLFVIIILILVIIKVFYTEVISYNKLKDLSDNLYSRRLPIMADRGKIVDRKLTYNIL